MNLTLAQLDFYPGDWWTILTAAACGVACGVPGVYLVLRRLSMLGDAISHAVLPGLAVAFLITGSRNVFPMLAGAMVTGLLTATLSAGISRLGKVAEDASLGVVFTSLFALGVLFISLGPRNVDLDAACVLYGLIDAVALDTRSVFGLNVPRPLLVLLPCALLNIGLVVLFRKELAITSFDPGLATALGFPARTIHYAFLAMIAATCVASFEAVGSILVVAMLIVPGATAALLTQRLGRMLIIAGVVAVVAAFVGYVLALVSGAAVAGAVSVALGVQFALALALSPSQGLLPRAWRRLALSMRIRQEDILANLYRVREASASSHAAAANVPGSAPANSLAATALRWRGLTDARGGLTPRGLNRAEGLIRAHRLWESYLQGRLDLPIDHLHDPAHRMEHFIDPRLEKHIAADVKVQTDPQGKHIPGQPSEPEA